MLMPDSPLYLPSDYMDRTRSKTEGVAKTGAVAKTGTVTHTEHWDGSVDATVRPATARMKAKIRLGGVDGADPDPQHVQAIAVFEKASRRLDFARRTGDAEFVVKAERALYAAQRRLEETQ
jgi:hypothetical protein